MAQNSKFIGIRNVRLRLIFPLMSDFLTVEIHYNIYNYLWIYGMKIIFQGPRVVKLQL